MIRADFHSHTHRSRDARTRPRELVERAAEVGLDRIAVTDHGDIEGALEARSLDPARVIVGEEIRCRGRTELIGLFLTRRIPMGLSVDETVERVRDQGGVVYAPHPFAYLIRPGWHGRRVGAVADMVEGFNSRAFYPSWNGRAARYAALAGLPMGAGSDAHFPHEIGRAYTEMPPFSDAVSFLAAAPAARAVGRAMGHPALHLASAALRATAPIRSGWALPPRPAWPDPRSGTRRPVPASLRARSGDRR